MSCSFTVTSVVPTISSTGQITALDVQGTASFTPPNSCTTVDLRIICGPVVVASATAPISTTGTWSHHFASVPQGLASCCDKDVVVSVSCGGCPAQQFQVPMHCKCPSLGGVVCYSEPCRPDGTVLLTFSGQLMGLGGSSSVTLQWTFDGPPVGPAAVLTSPGTVSGHLVVPGDGQAHTLALTVASPAGCPPVQITVQLPDCSVPKCPSLGAIVCNIEPCRPDGTVLLTFSGHLLSLGSYSSVTLEWIFGTTHLGQSTWTSPGAPSGQLIVPGDGQPHTLTLNVLNPQGCPPVQITVQLPQCPPPCPVIAIHATVGECNAHGTRPVTITATLTGSSASAPVNGMMTTPCGPVSNSGVGTLTLSQTCILGPGTYTVTVFSGDCPPKKYTFKVEDCCPDIKIKYDVGECNKDGTRPVTITAVVTAANSSTVINAQMTGPCGTVNEAGTGSVTLTSSCNLNTGSYLVTVTSVGCKEPKTQTISVEDCCPTVDFRHEVCGWPICNAAGTRPVTIWATVNPHAGVSTTASLVDTASGNVLDSGSGSTPFTLTTTQDYSAGTNQVQVSFAAPLKCPPQTYSFCVPKCETLGCFVLRNIIVAALSTFLAITMMKFIGFLAVFLDTIPGTGFLWGRYLDFVGNGTLQSWLTAIQILALGVAVLTFVYWWLCLKILQWTIGACCFTCCMLRIVLWQTFLIVGLILLWFLACSWLLHLFFALIFLIIGYLLFLWWKATCCPGKCDPKFYLMWAFALAIGQAFVAIDLAHVTTHCVAWGTSINYPTWYTLILWFVTMVLRFIIGLLWAYFLLAWGCCLATCGRVPPAGRMRSVPETTRAMKCCGQ
jgi:hypothetical protein